jgi:site-specific recombinase XerC
MKALVLDSVSSPITKRVYNMALDEFLAWYGQEPRPGFTKATVSAWRVTLEERGLGSSSIIVRMSAIRKLAVEATDNGLLAPELAAGIQRVKSARSIGVRMGNWLSQKQAQALAEHAGYLDAERPARPCNYRRLAGLWFAPVRSGGAFTMNHIQQVVVQFSIRNISPLKCFGFALP